MTSHTPDDGFHEIQLNGKQLVFLFMAATVVSVVIFLCGVLVGRGVRAEQGVAAETAALGEGPVADATPASSVPPTPVGSDPRVAAPPPAVDDLSYFNRLEKAQPVVEELKPARSSSAGGIVSQSPREQMPAKPAPAPPRETAGAAKPGYAVQLAALNSRGEADAMAKRLASEGYAAYVLTPAGGTPAVYRVRVGTFDTRREAETVAAKLEKEKQFKPWVTR